MSTPKISAKRKRDEEVLKLLSGADVAPMHVSIVEAVKKDGVSAMNHLLINLPIANRPCGVQLVLLAISNNAQKCIAKIFTYSDDFFSDAFLMAVQSNTPTSTIPKRRARAQFRELVLRALAKLAHKREMLDMFKIINDYIERIDTELIISISGDDCSHARCSCCGKNCFDEFRAMRLLDEIVKNDNALMMHALIFRVPLATKKNGQKEMREPRREFFDMLLQRFENPPDRITSLFIGAELNNLVKFDCE